jgi:hypothetical protein
MPTTSAYRPLPPPPPANISPIDLATGKWTPAWAQWLRALESIVRETQSKV